MARFLFHIRNGHGLTPDEEGRDLADREAAYAAAVVGARSLLSDEVTRGTLDLGGEIEVADDEGQVLFQVPFSDVVEIRQPEPGGPGGGAPR
jgi:hypothetical protein